MDSKTGGVDEIGDFLYYMYTQNQHQQEFRTNYQNKHLKRKIKKMGYTTDI